MHRDVPKLLLLSVSLLVLRDKITAFSEPRSPRVKREAVGKLHLGRNICSTPLLSVSFLVLRCARVALSSCVSRYLGIFHLFLASDTIFLSSLS